MKRWLVLFLFCIQIAPLWAHQEIIVYLPGLLTSSRSMRSVELALSCTGFKTYPWDYESTRKHFEEHGSDLVCFLQQVALCNPGIPIHFVSHSSASLILRAALNSPECPPEAKIGRAVLFAPPSRGSRLARQFKWFLPVRLVLGSKSGKQLMTYDPCMIDLCFGNFPECMDVLVIAGSKGSPFLFRDQNDGFIALEETRLNTSFYWLCYPVSHGTLLKYTPALYAMTNFIAYGNKSLSSH